MLRAVPLREWRALSLAHWAATRAAPLMRVGRAHCSAADGAAGMLGAAGPAQGEVRARNREEEWRRMNARAMPTRRPGDREVWIRRIRSQATRRGWRETEAMMEAFATTERLRAWDDDALAQLERLLVCDDWFLTNIAAGTRAAPKELEGAALDALRDHVRRRRGA